MTYSPALYSIALAVFGAHATFDTGPWGPWGTLPLGGAATVLTVAWFVAVLNVVNFMDGSDAIVAAMAVVILAAAGGEHPSAAAGTLLPAAAATFGFLAWNAPPAKIFMGDGGSHLLGAVIALAPCSVLDPTGSVEIPGAPWVLVGAALLPSIVDVAEALLHKVRHRIPMSQAHHDHLYQRLVKATLQLRGEAGQRQVRKKVKTALAHGTHGFAGQCHAVAIIGT